MLKPKVENGSGARGVGKGNTDLSQLTHAAAVFVFALAAAGAQGKVEIRK
jgi:hypothetical protein